MPTKRLGAYVRGPESQVPQVKREIGSQGDKGQSWLVLVYRIHPEPTRLRSAVWRRLKALGAIYLQSGTAALPYSATSEQALKRLHHDIRKASDFSLLFRCEMLAGETDAFDAFNAARTDEYNEVIERCRDFLRQLEPERATAHFTFPELEDYEADLLKLQRCLAKIRDRDLFGVPEREVAGPLMAECAVALEVYANRVFRLDPYLS